MESASTLPTPSPADVCPPITDADIAVAAQGMGAAGMAAGSGARLLGTLLDERVGLQELAGLINAQPGIAVRVLRVANSAYYGHSAEVATVERAASLLGLTALRGIASAACFDRMTASQDAGPFDLAALRRHSLATACAAQALARQAAPELADEAFMAGLLHDFGLLVQWRLESRGRAGVATHARCGELLLRHWQLPSVLAAAVAGHDEPPPGPSLAGLLHWADRLACDAGCGFDRDRLPAPAAAGQAQRCGLDDAQLAIARAEFPQTLQRLSAVFGD